MTSFRREESTSPWATISVPFNDITKGKCFRNVRLRVHRPPDHVTLDVETGKQGKARRGLTFAPPTEADSQRYEAAPWPNVAAAGRSGEGKVPTFRLPEPSAPATAAQLSQALLHSVSRRWRWPPFVSLAAFSTTGKCFQMSQEKVTVSLPLTDTCRCFLEVSRLEAEELLESNPEYGSIIIRPSSLPNSYAVSIRQPMPRFAHKWKSQVFNVKKLFKKNKSQRKLNISSP